MTGPTFDEYASHYDGWFQLNPNVLESEVRLIASSLGEPGETLSVGCGSGLFEMLLRDHGIRIEQGAEPAEGMAAIARKRGMEVRIASAEDLPYPDASYDTVLANGVPAYLADLSGALREIARVLRPGGAVVIGDVPASSGYGMLYQLAAEIGDWDDPRLKKIAPAHPYPIEFVRAANWRTTEEVVAALEAAGFADPSFQQTLTTHPRFSNDAVEDPSPGYERGGYVAVRAAKVR